jgi:hypothetical protein
MKNLTPFIIGCLLAIIGTNVFADINKTQTGWVEKIMLPAEQITMDAKLDTGAAISSINAENIQITHKDKTKWVEFDIVKREQVLKHVSYPLQGYITIKARDDEKRANGDSQRPLILMKICMGDQTHLIKVNLIHREEFSYAFLLGREAMKQYKILVDPSNKYLVSLKCLTAN